MTFSKVALAYVAALALVAGCKRGATPPPFETYVKGEYRSPLTGKVYAPPEAALASWKILALQTEPRPVENPKWSTISVSDKGELSMPHGSAFRCIYNPAKTQAIEGEPPNDVEGWEVLREVRCSENGFRTSVTAGIKVVYDPKGAVHARSGQRAELELTEVIEGRLTKVSILLRTEGET